MTKGLKIWLWIFFIMNAWSVLSTLFSGLDGSTILTLAFNVTTVAGIALMLFKQKKLGLFLFLGAGIADIVSILIGTLLLGGIVGMADLSAEEAAIGSSLIGFFMIVMIIVKLIGITMISIMAKKPANWELFK